MPKTVTFTLKDDAQVYSLSFDFNAICEAEDAAGCNLMRPLAGGGVTARETRGLLYACLKPNHPEVLLPEAGDLLTKDRETVIGALLTVINAEEVKQAAGEDASE